MPGCPPQPQVPKQSQGMRAHGIRPRSLEQEKQKTTQREIQVPLEISHTLPTAQSRNLWGPGQRGHPSKGGGSAHGYSISARLGMVLTNIHHPSAHEFHSEITSENSETRFQDPRAVLGAHQLCQHSEHPSSPSTTHSPSAVLATPPTGYKPIDRATEDFRCSWHVPARPRSQEATWTSHVLSLESALPVEAWLTPAPVPR